MGISTFIMGILPNYAAIGAAAPVILTIVRLLQGISAGGEWGSAVSFLGEYAKPNNRAFIVSFSQVGSALGLLLGSLTGLLFATVMSQETLVSWGWRIAFLFGIVIAVFGYFLRKGIDETPVFKNAELVRQPIREVFKSHKKSMISQFLLCSGGTITYWLIFSYMPTYISVFLKLPVQTGFSLTALTLIVFIISLPVFGILADKFGRKPLMLISGGCIIVLGYPLFTVLAKTTSFAPMALVVALMAVFFSMLIAPATVLMSELYPAKVRVTGFSIPYQAASACFAGTAAMVATGLINMTGNVMAMPMYLCGTMVVSVATIIFLIPETKDVKYNE
jgi:MHS family proline/betaine transporter-like MFS transporter